MMNYKEKAMREDAQKSLAMIADLLQTYVSGQSESMKAALTPFVVQHLQIISGYVAAANLPPAVETEQVNMFEEPNETHTG